MTLIDIISQHDITYKSTFGTGSYDSILEQPRYVGVPTGALEITYDKIVAVIGEQNVIDMDDNLQEKASWGMLDFDTKTTFEITIKTFHCCQRLPFKPWEKRILITAPPQRILCLKKMKLTWWDILLTVQGCLLFH